MWWTEIGKNIENSRQTSLQEVFNSAKNLSRNSKTWPVFADKFKARLNRSGSKDIKKLMSNLKKEIRGNERESDLPEANAETKVTQIHESVQSLLSLPNGIPSMNSAEYEEAITQAKAIYNNTKLGTHDMLFDYSVVTIFGNSMVKTIKLNNPTDPSKNIQITFNKWQKRFNVTKNGTLVSSRVYM